MPCTRQWQLATVVLRVGQLGDWVFPICMGVVLEVLGVIGIMLHIFVVVFLVFKLVSKLFLVVLWFYCVVLSIWAVLYSVGDWVVGGLEEG